MSGLTYKDSGVDADRADHILESFSTFLKSRPADPNLLSGIGPYASLYSLKKLLNDYEDPLLVTCCDGVGTKSKLALDWNSIDGLGDDLVAMNVNDLLCVGGTPLVFLDYYACGKLSNNHLTTLLKSIQLACEKAQCALAGGETAEMPGIYTNEDFDLAGFSVGMVDRKNVLGDLKVKVGQTLIGIASSGLHSNGYSLIRKIVEKEKLQPNDKAPFGNQTWSELLLAPTHIYVKALKPHLKNLSGLAHITGGGLFGNLPRILPKGCVANINASAWPFTPLYHWIKEKAELTTQELLTTFNAGVGMVVACDETYATTLLQSLNQDKLKASVLGTVNQGEAGTDSLVLWNE